MKKILKKFPAKQGSRSELFQIIVIILNRSHFSALAHNNNLSRYLLE